MLELENVARDFWEAWPDDIELPQVTIEYLSTLHHFEKKLPLAIQFYVDDSCTQGTVGAGVACQIDYENGTYLAGCMAKAASIATHAFQGEHAAMVWALTWSIQISAWLSQQFMTNDVHVHFHFDALNTGYQTAGYWRTKEHGPWRSLLRALAQILERRHQSWRLHWQHVKAHNQHPLNELVDCSAKFAARTPWIPLACRRFDCMGLLAL